MSAHGKIHPYLNWVKERIDEMDAALALLESRVDEVHADFRLKADTILANLRKKRDEFRTNAEKQAGANEAAWAKTKAQLETDWSAFETEVRKYVEGLGAKVEQQKAIFKSQSDAQLKAWREAAKTFHGAGREFAAERRSEIEASVKRMEADAASAQDRLEKLSEAGTESWSALMGALAETRAAFDRANHAVQEAFKRAV
jgi:hypothetical protein